MLVKRGPGTLNTSGVNEESCLGNSFSSCSCPNKFFVSQEEAPRPAFAKSLIGESRTEHESYSQPLRSRDSLL